MNCKVTLKAVTPLHFGNGDIYKKGFDFLEANFVDINGLMKYFKENSTEILPDFAGAIERSELDKFVAKHRKKIPDKFLKPIEPKGTKPAGEIRKHIRDGLGNIYIPGSGIKGALRTAVIKSLVKNRDNEIDNLIRKYLKDNKDNKVNTKFADVGIVHSLFCHLSKYDAKNDIMKVLKISDSEPVNKTNVSEIIIKGTSKGPLWAEVIPAEAETSFYLDLDDFFLKSGPDGNKVKLFGSGPYDFRNLISDINDLSLSILAYHKKYVSKHLNSKPAVKYGFLADKMKELKGNQALLCLGYGAGWVGMTGNILGRTFNKLSPDEQRKLKSNLKLTKENHLSDEYPVTRRIINGRPMGWAVITFDDTENYFRKDWEFVKEELDKCDDYMDIIEGAVFSTGRKSNNEGNKGSFRQPSSGSGYSPFSSIKR